MVQGIASAPLGKENEAKPTAAAQLVKIFSDKYVFTIFPHGAIISNNGSLHGKIRNGLFDTVVALAGNKPVGFELINSPFGKEPFDGLREITCRQETGNYEHNYDGYIFFEPLEMEQGAYLLYDMYSDKYIEELKRRANMTNSSVEKWFDVENATKETIISKLKKNETQKRWTNK